MIPLPGGGRGGFPGEGKYFKNCHRGAQRRKKDEEYYEAIVVYKIYLFI